MNVSRWHRNTSLLALSLSIDSAIRNKEESTSRNPGKLRTSGLGSSKWSVAELSPRQRRQPTHELAPSESASASGGFRTTHAQSGLPSA
jgi:hypothetical protein